jgi:hypothetical protein
VFFDIYGLSKFKVCSVKNFVKKFSKFVANFKEHLVDALVSGSDEGGSRLP